MRALAIDVGTGTQDVLLFDGSREVENALRLILPSPTVIVAERIGRATAARQAVVLSGVTMGGGPSAWAARDHALAGLPIAATPDAARTFDDDLDVVRAMGVQIVSGPEAHELAARSGTVGIELGDLDLPGLEAAFRAFGVELATVDAVAVAVFDHGAAPAGVSDRRFRFDRLRERLAAEPEAGPLAFAYRSEAIPAAFTRLTAAAATAGAWLAERNRDAVPVVAMDTGPAAILGALEDSAARRALARDRAVVAVNVGNFHTLAMRIGPDRRIQAILEHHTGELRRPQLARYLRELAAGRISDADVFGSMGHGALVLPGWNPARRPLPILLGPRRELLSGRVIRGLGRPALAVPHADMMQAGPFGLLRALAHRIPALRAPIEQRLGPPR